MPLSQVCEFMKPARADSLHFSGSQRCEAMQQCFAQQPVNRSAQPPAAPSDRVR